MVRAADDGNRGEGNLTGAIQRRNKGGGRGARGSGEQRSSQQARESDEQIQNSVAVRRRRKRAKTGKRSEPGYTMTGAYVLQENYDRVKQLLADPEVKAELIGELDEWGVRHHPKKVGYSDLVEMLLLEWMERTDPDRE